MLRRFILGLSLAAILPFPTAAQNLEDILARYIKARGGMGKLAAVKSIRYSGSMTVASGLEVPMVLEQKRPNSMRLEFTIQGRTGIQAYDGKIGWMIMPFMGNADAQIMAGEDLKGTLEQAEFDGLLVNYRNKGHRVELAGKEPIDGREAWKLRVILKSGDVHSTYLDAQSYLTIKEISRRLFQGVERDFITSISNYKVISGLAIAHLIESVITGSPVKQRVIINKVEINPTLDDSRFVMPPPNKAGAKGLSRNK